MRSAKHVAKDVDDYIANAPDDTRPILVKLRRIFRQASPNLAEAIKWGVPCFAYEGMVGGFAAYKKHVSWGLWKAELLNDPDGLIGRGIMNGGKITNVSEIPPASKLVRLIKQVMALNEAGVKTPKPPPKPAPKPPADVAATKKSGGRRSAAPPSRPHASGSTSTGSPKPSAPKPEPNASRRRSSGSATANP